MSIPTPESRIEKFEQLAYGMFIHWGLYSSPGQGEWTQHLLNIPKAEYAKLADKFTADEFDAGKIAKLAKQAGMKYIVLTTRHHDGFSLYDTRGLCDYDAPHSAAGRDLIAEFVEGCRQEGIIPFFYHTTLDWYQDDFENDFDSYLEYLNKSIEILCTNYGKIGGFWFDGNWSKPDADWKEDELYGTIRKHQPEAMIVNNTGLEHRGEPGHPEIDIVTFEQGRPTSMLRDGMKKYIAAEMCQTMNQHWGIGENDFCYLSPKEIIENLCACRKVGANYLLNVGPTAGGKIPDYESAVFSRVGEWVKQNEKVIYNSKPLEMIHSCSDKDFAIETDGKIYLFIHDLGIAGHDNVTVYGGGEGAKSFKGIKRNIKSVRWLDNNEILQFSSEPDSGLFCFNATGYAYGQHLVVRVAEISLG